MKTNPLISPHSFANCIRERQFVNNCKCKQMFKAMNSIRLRLPSCISWVILGMMIASLALGAEFTFMTTNGAITINDYRGDEAVLTIPSTINGLPVVGIEYEERKYARFDTVFHPGLVGINIPGSVTNIAYCSFPSPIACEARNLAAINVAPSNPRFSSDEGVLFNKDQTALYIFPQGKEIGSYTIPAKVARIDAYAFLGCINLTNVLIGTNASSIGEEAFSGCANLMHLVIPRNVTDIAPGAFDNATSITVDPLNPAYCISDGVLFNKKQTVLIRVPKGNAMGSYAIPDTVTNIGKVAFAKCRNLTNIVIGHHVTQIGSGAFAYCGTLTNIVMGRRVTQIGNAAFIDCEKLSSVSLPNDITSIGNDMFRSCYSLAEIVIPDGVTYIGTNAFLNCKSLTNVIFGNRLTKIAPGAFRFCKKLSHITIGDSVTSIGAGAFSDCDALTNVVILKSVVNIGRRAFAPWSLK